MLSPAISHSQTTGFPDYILVTLKTSGGISPPDDIIWDNWRIDLERYVAVLYSVDKGLRVKTSCNQIDIDSVTL